MAGGAQGFVNQSAQNNGLVGGLGNALTSNLGAGFGSGQDTSGTPAYAISQNFLNPSSTPAEPVTTHANNQGVSSYTTSFRADAPNIQQTYQQPMFQPQGLQSLFNSLMGNYMYNPMSGFNPSGSYNRGINIPTRAPAQNPNLGRAARGTPAPSIDQGLFEEMLADYQARKAQREQEQLGYGSGGG